MPGPRTKTALILSDWQCDLQNQDYIDRTLRLAKDLQPDKIVHVGDETDATTIGRWVQGLPEEAEGNLQEQIDVTVANLRAFREAAPGASFDICYSNHLDRFTHSIRTRLPAFRHLRNLSVESLFGLDDLHIRFRREIFDVFPSVFVAHGHQFGLTSVNQYSKGSEWANRLGGSLVAGHTHRPLLSSVASGLGSGRSDFYMNVGCSMDFSKAEYITSKSPQWGLGVGLIQYNTRTGWIQPQLIVADAQGRFYFEGKWY